MFYWIVWLLVCIAFIIVYSVGILPILFTWTAGIAYRLSDRGIEKFNIMNGIAIMYEPSPTDARYISRYALYQRAEEGFAIFFMGEWAKRLQFVEFEISAYDNINRLLVKKRIIEYPRDQRITEPVPLPSDTEYISLSVRRADERKISSEKRVRPFFYLALFLFALAVAFDFDAIVYVAVRFLSRAIGGFSADGFVFSATRWCRLLLLPGFSITLIIYLAGLFLVHRQTLSTWIASYARPIKLFYKKIETKVSYELKERTIHLRLMFSKWICALSNALYAFFHNSFFCAIWRIWVVIYETLKRIFRSHSEYKRKKWKAR